MEKNVNYLAYCGPEQVSHDTPYEKRQPKAASPKNSNRNPRSATLAQMFNHSQLRGRLRQPGLRGGGKHCDHMRLHLQETAGDIEKLIVLAFRAQQYFARLEPCKQLRMPRHDADAAQLGGRDNHFRLAREDFFFRAHDFNLHSRHRNYSVVSRPWHVITAQPSMASRARARSGAS